MNSALLSQLAELEALRGNPAIVYHSVIADDAVRVLYEYLRKRGRTDRLDLVLSTTGGSITTARKIALLLREYARHVTILVPYRAWSAGTLLCLSADELVLGPMAELGPIDSHIGSAGSPPPDAPGMISAEDVRAFRQMAEEWFGVEREEDRLQVLALVAQRIFPTSLASFFRFDKLVRQIAEELLGYQLPDADTSTRQRIVDKLVGGYYAHDYILSTAEARDLGLQARPASSQEEEVLWRLNQACRAQILKQPEGAREEVVGLIVGTGFYARQVFQQAGAPMQQHDDFVYGDAPQGSKLRSYWRQITRRDGSRRRDVPQPEKRIDDDWEIYSM